MPKVNMVKLETGKTKEKEGSNARSELQRVGEGGAGLAVLHLNGGTTESTSLLVAHVGS